MNFGCGGSRRSGLPGRLLPSMARHYGYGGSRRAFAPSLWRSQGEGWGWVGSSASDVAVASRLTPLPQQSRCLAEAMAPSFVGAACFRSLPLAKPRGGLGRGRLFSFRRCSSFAADAAPTTTPVPGRSDGAVVCRSGVSREADIVRTNGVCVIRCISSAAGSGALSPPPFGEAKGRVGEG